MYEVRKALKDIKNNKSLLGAVMTCQLSWLKLLVKRELRSSLLFATKYGKQVPGQKTGKRQFIFQYPKRGTPESMLIIVP